MHVIVLQKINKKMERLGAGVYQILNTMDNKCYIGSSINIKHRWKQHMYALFTNTNTRHLQRAWNKYGESIFVFNIICYCKKDLLLIKEQEMIDFYKSANPLFGYNIRIKAESNLGIKQSEETKKKKRETALRGDDNPSKRPEVRQKISDANTGLKRTDETKKKISESVKLLHILTPEIYKGYLHTEESKRKIGLSHEGKPSWNKGIPFSEESCKKMSIARKGVPLNEEWCSNISKSLKGRVFSVEHCLKLSLAAKEHWAKQKGN
jgi:group I intron endonuclease